MKEKTQMKKMLVFGTITLLLIVLLLASITPALADEPITGGQSSALPVIPPLSDPSLANYNSPTINNLLDPSSPNYDAKGVNGPPGTRFGPPNARSTNLSAPTREDSLRLLDDHQFWGTKIPYNSNIYGVYGYQAVYNSINLNEDGDVLYAPTMIAPNQCSLELTTGYIRAGTTTYRYVKLYNHNSGSFIAEIQIDATFVSNYVRSGQYIGELLYDSTSGCWHAYLYNWNTSSWDGLGGWISPRSGQTDGWDAWEEYNLSNNWPTLPEIWSNYLTVKIGTTGNDWRRVTSTYGNNGGYTMTSWYPHSFINNYYYWHVQPH
jgi:hypothetical protein